MVVQFLLGCRSTCLHEQELTPRGSFNSKSKETWVGKAKIFMALINDSSCVDTLWSIDKYLTNF